MTRNTDGKQKKQAQQGMRTDGLARFWGRNYIIQQREDVCQSRVRHVKTAIETAKEPPSISFT